MYVVSNAGTADKVYEHCMNKRMISTSLGIDVDIDIMNKSLIALQGPKSVRVLERLSGTSLNRFVFMTSMQMKIGTIDAHVSRSGYTGISLFLTIKIILNQLFYSFRYTFFTLGEDGFEISVEHKDVQELCEILLMNSEVKNAGLGARNSLRMEAGMCLYGHDLSDDITPVEASITSTSPFVITQKRSYLGNW